MATGSATSTDDSRSTAPLTLWWAPLDIPASSVASLAACLSPEERARADEYAHRLDRRHFVVARGWLRHLLAAEMGRPPGEIGISIGGEGKPEVESSDLKFNASRSAGIALYATSWVTEVGVDIESIRDGADDVAGIAAKFFSADESRALAALPREQRRAATFQCWTCKEAFVKGIGAGLTFPIHTVDTWAEGSPTATVSGWTIHRLEVAPGFAAAVAGEGLEGWVPTVPSRISPPDPDLSPAIIDA